MKIVCGFISLIFLVSITYAQETFPVNGVFDKNHNAYAFINATIYKDYKTKIENGTLVVRDGKVERLSADATIPADAVVFDLKHMYIYPSFIDLYSNLGMPDVKKSAPDRRPQLESDKYGPWSWNESIKPEVNAYESFKMDDKKAAELRKIGFGSVLTHQQDGIMRGTSVLVALGDERANENVIREKGASMLSFSKGSSRQTYPSSLMGVIALLRQTYFDAAWYRTTESEKNLSLQAVNDNANLPQIFEANDHLSILRADKLGDEFNIQYILKGSGSSYQRLAEIKKTNASLLVPLNFPAAYEVEDIYEASWVTLEQMKHWEMAPMNAGLLEKAGIDFALTADGIKDKKDFLSNLRKAVENGLSKEIALAALTVNPADMIGLGEDMGALYDGMMANFLITSGDIFSEKTKIHENWVQGKQFIVSEKNQLDLAGAYDLSVGKERHKLEIAEKDGQFSANLVVADTVKVKVAIKVDEKIISLTFNPDPKDKTGGKTRLTGFLNDSTRVISGSGDLDNGQRIAWSAKRTGDVISDKKEISDSTKTDSTKQKTAEVNGEVWFPNMEYGFQVLPSAQTIVFRNATVWTNEKDGIVEGIDVLVSSGKIMQVGKKLKAADAIQIDARGKHLTSGIIDEHSHIAISHGVNEGGQAISAEVSIADVVNSEDVNIYRQLSGGVTASQLLHGSANPIGGQSALIKLRWGRTPEEMKIKGADGFIKFALGENVKQSNWGDHNTIRYPQTRMGVEQVFYDAFHRAQEYDKKRAAFALEGKKGIAPRKDLELEALSEILRKKRFITCHSYMQHEINMLMHVADSMGFKVNTFTHILEGYKVADKMKIHGVGGSTFSDWWAYKFEVNEAIPYNAAIMQAQGVVVAINSDDAEMGRRLNQEAAKTVKYGGVSEEDAWKMVTLNPAKLLHLDKQMGSILAGKDADLVVWSDNPLSVYAKVEQTYIDGILYYDANRDLELRKAIQAERNRLIQKMLAAKKGGSSTQKGKTEGQKLYHCDTIEDEAR